MTNNDTKGLHRFEYTMLATVLRIQNTITNTKNKNITITTHNHCNNIIKKYHSKI